MPFVPQISVRPATVFRSTISPPQSRRVPPQRVKVRGSMSSSSSFLRRGIGGRRRQFGAAVEDHQLVAEPGCRVKAPSAARSRPGTRPISSSHSRAAAASGPRRASGCPPAAPRCSGPTCSGTAGSESPGRTRAAAAAPPIRGAGSLPSPGCGPVGSVTVSTSIRKMRPSRMTERERSRADRRVSMRSLYSSAQMRHTGSWQSRRAVRRPPKEIRDVQPCLP